MVRAPSAALAAHFAHRTLPVIGMVHLPALPGAPRYGGALDAVIDAALLDARALEDGGVAALIIENFGDVPFHKERVPAITVAAMTRVVSEVARATRLPFGINCLRNDGEAALAIACATGASFIRVNVFAGAVLTDQGVIEGRAADLLRLRAHLAVDVAIVADVQVKHAAPLVARPIEREIDDTLVRALADGVIVSGEATGAPAEHALVARARAAAGSAPLWIGSGVSAESVHSFVGVADAVIVGTALKRDGDVLAPVDVARVRALVARASDRD